MVTASTWFAKRKPRSGGGRVWSRERKDDGRVLSAAVWKPPSGWRRLTHSSSVGAWRRSARVDGWWT